MSSQHKGSLTLRNLTKRFGNRPAVENLWLQIEPGEIVSLLGPSGCGKSTTLQMIAGILRPDEGTIELDGQVLNPIAPEKRDIALVLQRGLLFPHLTVGENVAFGLKMRGINRADRDAKAIAMLRQVQLEGFGDRRPAELSGGQAQRVALARSLVIHPKLLLLDEPLSALDANLREEMQELILQLQSQTETTFLLVTHDQSEAVVLSQRIALMFAGRLRQVDTPEQIYRRPVDESTARFMGGVNFFAATAQGQRWVVSDHLTLMSDCTAEGAIRVTIRPEQIQVLTTAIPGTNLFPARVVAQRFTGTQRRVTVAIMPNLHLQAWIAPSQALQNDQPVWVSLPPAALWCFPPANSLTESPGVPP